jgi:hypothetical protein
MAATRIATNHRKPARAGVASLLRSGEINLVALGETMSFPMPPELLEQLGLEPCADADPQWSEDREALGFRKRVGTPSEFELPGEPHFEEDRNDH